MSARSAYRATAKAALACNVRYLRSMYRGFHIRLLFVGGIAAALFAGPTAALAEQEGCSGGEQRHFVFGFATIQASIGDAMGQPVSCEFADPNGTGDVHQRTTTGLAFWRKSTNTPTFTDGWQHWALQPTGLMSWVGNSTDPPASPTAAPAAAASLSPSDQQIAAEMARTVEVDYPSEHFASAGRPVTVLDGRGGTLTGAIGVRSPTADGKGQLIFFWHNGDFLGWDSDRESASIEAIAPGGPGVLSVTYTNYAPTDPLCCPSRPPVSVSYTWDGQQLSPSGALAPGRFPVYVKRQA